MIVVIPARKGSKRCENKNARFFIETTRKVDDECSIEECWNITDLAVHRARAIFPEEIIVTTDYPYEIGRCGWRGTLPLVNEGVIRWHKRPKVLCGDEAKSEDVVKDVLWDYFNRHGKHCSSFCLMQPTSPLGSDDSLKDAKEIFESHNYPALVSVNPAYQPNGCFYFCDTKTFLFWKTFFPSYMGIYVMDWHESMDINEEYQFRIAQAMKREYIHGKMPERQNDKVIRP